MSGFGLEAFFIGIKEGAKIAICAFLAFSLFRSVGREYLKKPLAAGLLVVFLASFAVMGMQVTVEARNVLVRMVGYVFGLIYLLSLGALFHTTGTDMLGPLGRMFEKKSFLVPAVFLAAVVYFVPDMAGSSLYVVDLFSMAGRAFGIFLASAAGFAVSLSASYAVSRNVRADVTKLFGLPQVLLVFALLKLIAGGVRGFAELSLIPTVQAGLMKLVHDMVHQTFVLLMVPDHPVLTTTTWNFIGVVFGNAVGLWLSLILITLPLIIFIKKHFSEEVTVPPDIPVAARKRKFIKSIRDERVLKSIPVFVFLIFIVSTWFVQQGEGMTKLYNPAGKPVTAENDMVFIPLQTPGEDLRDGSIHKFLFSLNGENARLLIMKKPDGTLAVCLDACEICPPDGYGQGREHVVCLYCNTPIPFDTLGKPGGCNPIPLTALVTDKDVRIGVPEIAGKWAKVKSGEAKEGIER